MGPVSLVNHQAIDPVVVGLVVLEPHAAVLVGVGVPGHIDPGPVDDVGLGLGAVIWPRGILSIHSAVIEEGNEVSVVINFISLQKYFGPERISETSLRRQKCDVSYSSTLSMFVASAMTTADSALLPHQVLEWTMLSSMAM